MFFPHCPWMLQASPLSSLPLGHSNNIRWGAYIVHLVSEILPVFYKWWSFSLYNYFYPPLHFCRSSQHHVHKQWRRAPTCEDGPTKHEIIRQVHTTSALLTMKFLLMSLNRKPIGARNLSELGGEQRRPFPYCKSNPKHPTSVTRLVTFEILWM